MLTKACTVCLSTSVKLFDMDKHGSLRRDFNTISGLKTQKGNGMPSFLCVECTAYVRRYKGFRDKCHRAYYTLQEILNENNEITDSNLNSLDRNILKLMPSLSFLDPIKASYEEIQFKWTKQYRRFTQSQNIPMIHVMCGQIEEIELPLVDETIKEEKADPNIISIEDFSFENMDDTGHDHYDCDETTDNNFIIEYVSEQPVSSKLEALLRTSKTKKNEPDGIELDQEYGKLVPLTLNEMKAVHEVNINYQTGKCNCEICGRSYQNESQLVVHMRMHDRHWSGVFNCEICSCYYKTEFLLKIHMNEKHLYKYLCRKCPEVSFVRSKAKQHYMLKHHSGERPDWCKKRSRIMSKDSAENPVPYKKKRISKDYIKRKVQSPLEQHKIINERKKSKNYTESNFRCELCYRGYREARTYDKHMVKHNKEISGPCQCDICKVYVRNTRLMYTHMVTTHCFKYTCRLKDCTFLTTNSAQAAQHRREHMNTVYNCPYCDKEFKKFTTRLSHIRVKHPSTQLCNICGHSFVSAAGVYFHLNMSHTVEERALSKDIQKDLSSPLFCADCDTQFHSQEAFITHLGSSSKHATVNFSVTPSKGFPRAARAPRPVPARARRPRPDVVNNGVSVANTCHVCGESLPSDVKANKHYAEHHPGIDCLKRYMCDICGHTTKHYANLLGHMRRHTREQPYACPHCDRRFSMHSNRDRHLLVHTGERPHECPHCQRRFTQSTSMKLHIQTVHLKIPYKPWDKKNRKRRKEAEAIQTSAHAQ